MSTPLTADATAVRASNGRRLLPLAAVTGLFVIWGLAQWNYNVVFPQLATYLQFNARETTWTQALLNITYCVLAVPAALFHRRFGYKLGVMFALTICSLGPFLLYPAGAFHNPAFFFGSVVLMGTGWTLLETSLNPLAAELGQPKSAARRLNFAQAFYPIGLVAGALIAQHLLQPDSSLSTSRIAQMAVSPYIVVGIAVLLLAFVVDKIRFPELATGRAERSASAAGDLRALLGRREFRFACLALFCAIFAQATTWGSTFVYVPQEVPQSVAQGLDMFLLSCILCGVGRFTGTALMGRIEPARLLTLCIAISAALIVPVVWLGGATGVACLVSTSLFMSIAYPTIFASAIRGLGPQTKIASGLLVTAAGIASAAFPFILERVDGAWGNRAMLFLTIPCFAVLVAYLRTVRRDA